MQHRSQTVGGSSMEPEASALVVLVGNDHLFLVECGEERNGVDVDYYCSVSQW